jgi:drug/metabolite transporter (DMT)-like permease
MDYFILLLAVLCIAVQFNANKFYQKNFTHTVKDMLFFPFISGAVNFIFFVLLGFILYGKLPGFSIFSFAMSIALAVVSTLSVLVGLLIMKYGKMSVYSVFMMLGGMILPYFYGMIFLGETVSPARVIGLIILIGALPCSVSGPSGETKAVSANIYYILCVFIFILNGMMSIISKTHSINISAIPAVNFIVYANLWGAVINGMAYFIFAPRLKGPEKREAVQKKPNKFYAALTITVYAVVGGAGYLFQLISAETVPAVAMFPFVTGGSIVLSTIFAGIFFKERIGRLSIAGIIMSLAGTLLFLI